MNGWRGWVQRSWQRWGVLLILTALTAILLRGWLRGPLPSTPRQEGLAELHITASFLDDLQQGRVLSAWNPREFGGYAWLRFLAYPVYLALAAVAYLGRLPLTSVMVGFFFLCYLASALTLYAYARKLGLVRGAALVAAVAYQWAPFHAHMGAEVWIHAAFWALLPLILLVIEHMYAEPGRLHWALLLGVLLAGSVVLTIEYTMLAAPFIALYLLVREAMLLRAGHRPMRSLWRLALVGAVALGLAAFFVWPAITSTATVGIHNKHAAGSTFSDTLLRGYSLSPSLVLYAVSKRLHLPLPAGELPALASAAYSVTWYPGVIAGALGLVGLCAAFRRRRLRLIALLWALGLVVALGPNLPGNPFPRLPGFGRLMPWRTALFIVAFGALLVGLGAQWVMDSLKRLPFWPGRGSSLPATLNCCGLRQPVLIAALLVLLLLDWGPSASAFIGVERYFAPAEEAAHAWLRENAEAGYRLWEPNALPREDYRAILDVTRTGIPRYWGYYDNGAPLYAWQAYNWGELAANLRVSSTRYALLSAEMEADADVQQVIRQLGLRPVEAGLEGGPTLYEDPQALPYARAYPAAALYVGEPAEDALRVLPALVARNVALVCGASPYLEDYDLAPYRYLLAETARERQPGAKQAGLSAYAGRVRAAGELDGLPVEPLWGAEHVQWERPAPDVVRVQARLDAPALLTVAEAWYPGWEAAIDGRPAPLLRANYAYLGVWVEAGEHQVTFRYRPPAPDRIALAVSACTAIAVAVAWAFSRGDCSLGEGI